MSLAQGLGSGMRRKKSELKTDLEGKQNFVCEEEWEVGMDE